MASTPAPKLFAVYLGGRAPRCNTELHDVVFVAGPSVPARYHELMDKWFGNPLRVHLDSWLQLDVVDGHSVRLSKRAPSGPKRLFFVNLGAYLPNLFTEVHANAFVVAETEQEVKRRAKRDLLRGHDAVHTDDLYDIDDCLEVSEVDGFHVHLAPTRRTQAFAPHNGYHVIPPDVVKDYARDRKLAPV